MRRYLKLFISLASLTGVAGCGGGAGGSGGMASVISPSPTVEVKAEAYLEAAKLLRALANVRCLSGRDCARLSEGAQTALQEWLENGWLQSAP